MKKSYSAESLEDTRKIAKELMPLIKNKIIFLEGEVGAGKTTFTKYLVEAFGLSDEAYSPTFSIENRYDTPNGLIIHFDLYRLKNDEELDMIGFSETINEKATILIEWANKFPIDYIKNPVLMTFTNVDEESRFIVIEIPENN